MTTTTINPPPATSFASWSRENLERLCQDLQAENYRLQDDLRMVQKALRDELRRVAADMTASTTLPT